MSLNTAWNKGDRVAHPDKPEWGAGVVERTVSESRDGRAIQRVTVRFDRAGRKTLSTAFAHLVAADDPGLALAPPETDAEAEAERLTVDELRDKLHGLPENCTDPFRSRSQRLRAVLDLYRFTPRGSSLLDWAASQTSMRDPLSHFARHELEAAFERFTRARTQGALVLVRELAREEPEALRSIGQSASPDELAILRELVAKR